MSTDPKLKTWVFETAVNCPGSWWVEGHSLKTAADGLDLYDENHQRKPDPSHQSDLPFLFPVHLLLLGLSFENLLKALLIMQGISPLNGRVLSDDFKTHKVDRLLNQVDSRRFPIDPKEREVLLKCQEFVEWQGRYRYRRPKLTIR